MSGDEQSDTDRLTVSFGHGYLVLVFLLHTQDAQQDHMQVSRFVLDGLDFLKNDISSLWPK